MKKNVLAVVFAVVMTSAFVCACGSKAEAPAETEATVVEETVATETEATETEATETEATETAAETEATETEAK